MLQVSSISPILRSLQVLRREIGLEPEHVCGRPFRQFRFVKIAVARSDVAVGPPVHQIHYADTLRWPRRSAALGKRRGRGIPSTKWEGMDCDADPRPTSAKPPPRDPHK